MSIAKRSRAINKMAFGDELDSLFGFLNLDYLTLIFVVGLVGASLFLAILE